ncbi:hypothetical protein [Sphingobium sp. DN12]|uniref:hypothetical protein n=1 Tax=Sphingobium sp. DN12 TaxID=3378073 RepID=UPI003DA5EFFE
MPIEIWYNGEKVGDWSFASVPEVGDQVELDLGGEIYPYQVEKLFNYYVAGNGTPTLRMNVSYAGPSFFGVL